MFIFFTKKSGRKILGGMEPKAPKSKSNIAMLLNLIIAMCAAIYLAFRNTHRTQATAYINGLFSWIILFECDFNNIKYRNLGKFLIGHTYSPCYRKLFEYFSKIYAHNLEVIAYRAKPLLTSLKRDKFEYGCSMRQKVELQLN